MKSTTSHTHILLIVGISAITSLIMSSLLVYAYVHMPIKSVLPVISSKTALDSNGNKYEVAINAFLSAVQKGDLDTAYKSTSPIFQKLTTRDDFKKLINEYTVNQNIPASPCVLTEYSDPSAGTITGIPGEHMIVQAKCEATEKGIIKGFIIEFIDDAGTYKISFINVYKTPIIHKVER